MSALTALGYVQCDTCHVETHPDDLASPHECKRCAPVQLVPGVRP